MSTQTLLREIRSAQSDGEGVVLRAPGVTTREEDFALSVAEGLSAEPKWLDCTYLYDETGSKLFGLICEQPEYYLTRTETRILRDNAAEISAITGNVNLIELGSGYSAKTTHILSAYLELIDDPHYVPVDVSHAALHAARKAIAASHPEVQFSGIMGTYESVIALIPSLSPAMVIFLGSTVGNMNESQANVFFRDLAGQLSSDDFVLLGIDLAKEDKLIEAAYNDAAGITAAFTLNLFARMNRELGSDIDLGHLEHLARYSPTRRRIETHVRFETDQDVYLEPLERTLSLRAGEEVLVEISRKFVLDEMVPELEASGLRICRSFTDARGWLALLLLRGASD
jgi:L-histidine N-alpha-methyltransferase